MAAPLSSLAVVIIGYVIQNNNLNARISEIRSDLKDVLRAELGAIRAEMAKNHSELLHKLVDLENRIHRIEARRP